MIVETREAIRAIRGKQKISQEKLARKLGVSFTTVNRWETGKSVPRKGTALKIEKLLTEAANYQKKMSIKRSSRRLAAFSFFSGAGGFHLGIEKVGFDVLVATDIEPAAEKTHKANWPRVPFIRKDIRKLSAEELLEASGGRKPDLIFAGPPCQGFSTLGDKSSADPRNQLFDSLAKLVEELSPNFILIENVKSLKTMYKGQYYEYIVRVFTSLGYTMYSDILNAADYGVPQFRERVVFFGTKLDHPYAFPEPRYGEGNGLKPYETVGGWIGDLVDKGPEIPGHIPLNHSDRVVRRYKLIPEGGKLPPPEELPKDIRRNNFGSTYKRLHRKRPSVTLVPGNNAFPVHPTLDRSLTPREAARLQTFPDNFVFLGDRRKQCILVGNAVPPTLAEELGESVISHLKNKQNGRKFSEPVRFITEPSSSRDSAEKKIMPIEKLLKLPEERGFIDLFCGAGGFTIGFARAGFRPLLAADLDDSVSRTHEKNYPSVPFLKGDLSKQEIKHLIFEKFSGKEVGIIVGGPPCQGFSIFGKRRFVNNGYDPRKDPRNKLVFSFIEIVKEISPRWFVMENVPGLVSLDKGKFFECVIDEFQQAGYKRVEAKILTAANYGVPQLRRRLVIIGNKTGHVIPWPKKKFFETPKDWQKPFRTVGEVILDLANGDSYDKQSCHVPMKHKPLVVERYKYIPEGGKLNIAALPDHLKTGYRTENVKNYSHVFRRLHRDEPSITMVPGHNAFPIHPWLDRALTVREAARIQTFPDEVEFKGTRQEQCIQVGNAFPPLLAELIANNIRKAEVNGWYSKKVPRSAFYSIIEKSKNDDEILAKRVLQ